MRDVHIKVQDCCGENNQQIEFNPLTPEINSSAQRWLTRFFTGDFAS
jgi:hypothetical protein